MREGLRAVLERAPDIEIVGEAKDGVETWQMVAELRPDILLLDLVMPGLRPFEVEKWVRTKESSKNNPIFARVFPVKSEVINGQVLTIRKPLR